MLTEVAFMLNVELFTPARANWHQGHWWLQILNVANTSESFQRTPFTYFSCFLTNRILTVYSLRFVASFWRISLLYKLKLSHVKNRPLKERLIWNILSKEIKKLLKYCHGIWPLCVVYTHDQIVHGHTIYLSMFCTTVFRSENFTKMSMNPWQKLPCQRTVYKIWCIWVLGWCICYFFGLICVRDGVVCFGCPGNSNTYPRSLS